MSEQSTQPEVKQEATKDAKAKKREQNLAAMALLLETYPEIFNLQNARPLKIGIHEELAADGKISKTKIRKALATYVRQTAYLKSFQEGAERIGVDGKADGVVSAEDAQHAQQTLAERFKKRNQNQGPKRGPRGPHSKSSKPKAQGQDKPQAAKERSNNKPRKPAESSQDKEARFNQKLEALLANKGKVTN